MLVSLLRKRMTTNVNYLYLLVDEFVASLMLTFFNF